MQTCQGAYRVKEARVFWNTAREFESPGDFMHLARLSRSHPSTRVGRLASRFAPEKEKKGENLMRAHIFEIVRFPAVIVVKNAVHFFLHQSANDRVFVDHYRSCITRRDYFSCSLLRREGIRRIIFVYNNDKSLIV